MCFQDTPFFFSDSKYRSFTCLCLYLVIVLFHKVDDNSTDTAESLVKFTTQFEERLVLYVCILLFSRKYINRIVKTLQRNLLRIKLKQNAKQQIL